MNEELRSLLAADQHDRAGGTRSRQAVQRDHVRLTRVKELLDAAALQDGEDLFCAAMILEHGSSLDDFWRAHQLAKASADRGHAPARWLPRLLTTGGSWTRGNQHFRTQYFSMASGPLRLWEVDPATTDHERAEWDVPPLSDALDRVNGQVQAASIQCERRAARAVNTARAVEAFSVGKLGVFKLPAGVRIAPIHR